MAIRIPVGKENFDEVRKTGLYYVDKTELVYELVGAADNEVTLFTRPRRFGKTLNMSMMESFFDINRDSRAVIIEAKKSDSASQMEKDCEDALKQIRDKKYARGMEPGYEKILCYGISFFQKSAMIRKL